MGLRIEEMRGRDIYYCHDRNGEQWWIMEGTDILAALPYDSVLPPAHLIRYP